MEFLIEYGYLGLFIAAFLAASILPFGSEFILTALLFTDSSPVLLVACATFGNVLGSIMNYLLGYYLTAHRVKRYLKISEDRYSKIERFYEKYGLWTLLLAWVPIIGDPITVLAGLLRLNFVWFVAIVSVSKLLRYVVLTLGILQIVELRFLHTA